KLVICERIGSVAQAQIGNLRYLSKNVANLIDQFFVFQVLRFDLRQLLEQLALFARQSRRRITETETKRSPLPRPPSTGMPCPRTRNTVPVCVPAGILRCCFSFSVWTLISAPNAAWANVI